MGSGNAVVINIPLGHSFMPLSISQLEHFHCQSLRDYSHYKHVGDAPISYLPYDVEAWMYSQTSIILTCGDWG